MIKNKVYRFINHKICPIQEAVVIAESEIEALEMIKNETDFLEGWEYAESFEYRKGLLFSGDADC